jgi:serine protease Do
MRSGKSQLVAIILAVVIAFGCGLGGGVAAMYLVNNGVISLAQSGTLPDTQQALNNIAGDQGRSSSALTPSGTSVPSTNVVYNFAEDTTIAEAIADKAMPSVVGITTTYNYSGTSGLSGYGFWGWSYGGEQTYEASAVGSGVIVDEAGYILTNAHVINDGDYNKVVVSLYDGSEAEATVVWYRSTLDLAVLKIDAKGLVAAELGDSDELKIGAYAAAIGNPLGLEFQRSMSQGIISGLDRSIAVSSGSGSSTSTMDGLIQTDASINSGNSGGPLINCYGQVIGINSSKMSSNYYSGEASVEGLCFAIPMTHAQKVINDLIHYGYVTGKPQISIYPEDVDKSISQRYGLPVGVYVKGLVKGGAAEAAGVQPRDIIIAVDDKTISSYD